MWPDYVYWLSMLYILHINSTLGLYMKVNICNSIHVWILFSPRNSIYKNKVIWIDYLHTLWLFQQMSFWNLFAVSEKCHCKDTKCYHFLERCFINQLFYKLLSWDMGTGPRNSCLNWYEMIVCKFIKKYHWF